MKCFPRANRAGKTFAVQASADEEKSDNEASDGQERPEIRPQTR